MTFTTVPHGTPTHWKQTLFYLDPAVRVTPGEVVPGSITVSRPKGDARSIDVQLRFKDREQKYSMN